LTAFAHLTSVDIAFADSKRYRHFDPHFLLHAQNYPRLSLFLSLSLSLSFIHLAINDSIDLSSRRNAKYPREISIAMLAQVFFVYRAVRMTLSTVHARDKIKSRDG